MPPTTTDWSTLKVVDLRAELSSRGLPTKGVKADLIQRLTEADAAAAQAEEPETEVQAAFLDEADQPVDDGAKQEVTKAESAAEELSPVVDTNAIANEDATAHEDEPANVKPATSQLLAAEETKIALPDMSEQPGILNQIPPSDAAFDLQKRKRRSSTPPPSAKRARQEEERHEEDFVDFETGDISASPEKRAQNGVVKKEEVKENFKMEDHGQPMEDVQVARDTLGISGEEANAPQVALTEISKVLPSAQPQDPTLEVTGEEAFMKRVAIGMPSEAPHHTPQPLEPAHEDRQYVTLAQQQRDVTSGDYPGGNDHTEDDRPSLPSTHPPTNALYIRDLMRPLRSEMVEQYIVDLLTPPGGEPDPKFIEDFYLDQIRTHAFVVLTSVSAAQRVRAAFHNQVWPNESNRKKLWADFIPPSQVKDWIEREESAPRGGSRRWEVVYEQDRESVVAIHQEIGSDSQPFSRPPPTGPAVAGPVYPGIEAAPRGPRGRGGRPPFENPNTLQTQTHPRLSYTPLSEDVARRRIDNMRSFYSRDPPTDLGKDYHRFTFENVDAFVDRGREVFIGIRPPHRQKEHEDRVRRERLGTAGASSVAESRRDDYRPPPRPPVTDEDRFSRYDDSRRPNWPPRNRGYRGDRGPGRFRGEDPYRYRPGY